jgi:hypothetical protein
MVGGLLLPGTTRAQQPSEYTWREAIKESMFGDVYANPDRWKPLSLGEFFTEGWSTPWVSPPNGSGGAPRQGWLNADDGVFYRLAVGTFGYSRDFQNNGNQYIGLLQGYLPFNARFEVRLDVPFVTSNRTTGNDYHTGFGDVRITPRFLLSESKDVTQSFNVTIRTPSGQGFNGNGVFSVSPDYEFWANWWRGLVVRGGAGMVFPDHGSGGRTAFGADIGTGSPSPGGGPRTSFVANVAPGYYFTPHDLAPFGDLVWYVSANLTQLTDSGAKTTTVTMAPGFRDYLGWNWYLLGAVVVPVTNPQSFDYQVQAALMWVF